MQTENELREGSLAFEHKNNSRYRYSKLKGKTPLNALLQSSTKQIRVPSNQTVPRTPMEKPESGRYHLIRFIRTISLASISVFNQNFNTNKWWLPSMLKGENPNSSEINFRWKNSSTDYDESIPKAGVFHQLLEY